MHGEYNKTRVILKLVNIMNTLLVHTLLDASEHNPFKLKFGLYGGRWSGEIKQCMVDVGHAMEQ